MIDIKLRNVKVEDALYATRVVTYFMQEYADRRGIRNGVAYGSAQHSGQFYVYRTDKTVVCVGQYDATPETER